MKSEDVTMPFGKHKGDTLGDILAEDPKYLLWLADLEDLREPLASAVADINERYEHEINPDID